MPFRHLPRLVAAVLAGLLMVATVFPAPAGAGPDATEATVYRLYRAYFLREPDRTGFAHWVYTHRRGYPLENISNDFARSAEFQSRYGQVDDRRFLELVYRNMLGRVPDRGGYDYWLGHMSRGMPRGYVMIYFSDSAEFRGKVGSGTVTFSATAAEAARERDAVAYIGQRRAAHGRAPVTRNACLDEVARMQAHRNAAAGEPQPIENGFAEVSRCGRYSVAEENFVADGDADCVGTWKFRRDYTGREDWLLHRFVRHVGVGVVVGTDGWAYCNVVLAG